ncbi:MAG: DUF296 domain-containing protein [Erysipelotrichaceae bacterium]|nr:DUF296 domain-containing protein [Erysipelotrichaceae bacterium]
MKEYAFRLTYGSDLKTEIQNYCIHHQISAAVVISLVGCVYEAKLRMAGGKIVKSWKEDFEIVSCTGTISSGKAHLHVVFSDVDGHCYGGHLQEGCFVNSTCEVVLGELESYDFTREFDETTGYNEIVITKK